MYAQLAAALNATPADLLAHSFGGTLTIGERELSGSQVVEWFRGNREALVRPFLRSIEEMREDARGDERLAHLLEGVALLSEAVKRKDGPALVHFSAYVHNTLAAISDWSLSQDELNRIDADYDIPGGE